MTRRLRLLAAALLLVVCAACQVSTEVGVRVEPNGSGTVRVAVALDQQAAQRFQDLKAQVQVDDLRRAGWEIVGPRKEGDGKTWVRASKGFATPADAGRVMDEVSGPTGPFRSFRVTRTRSLWKTQTRFRGTVDLAAGIEAFSDDDLRKRLGGSTAGVDPRELERQMGEVFARIFQIRIAAQLPGTITANAPQVVDGGAVWRPNLGERATLEADAETWNTSTIAFGAGTALVALLLLGVLFRRLLRR